MTKLFIIVLLILTLLVNGSRNVLAIYTPLSVPNNRLGVHILAPEEIERAAEFVNGEGKEWGYVVVPIRSDDRDYIKWKLFFEKANEKKVIPVIRIATYGFEKGWAIPSENEILHTAHFLDQMPWPTENRYIILFNEPNHAWEWGGSIDPEGYARLMSFAVRVYKTLNPDFYILPAALDRAAPDGAETMKADTFLKRAIAHDRIWLDGIDGWNSHAYPNPAFAQPPNPRSPMNILSYTFEQSFLQKNGKTELPVFITETGWSQDEISEHTIVDYWQTAWNNFWNDERVVLVTAWLLQANDGPFKQFTLVNRDNTPNLIYQTLQDLPRVAGAPLLAIQSQPNVLGDTTESVESYQWNWNNWKIDDLWRWFGSWWFTDVDTSEKGPTPRLEIGSTMLEIEIADDEDEQRLGLGHREYMEPNHGMLFVYSYPDYHGFWMKHTLFPLDIIWIRGHTIVEITRNIPVEEDPTRPKNTFYPQTPVDMVLEVNGGWADRYAITTGMNIHLFK